MDDIADGMLRPLGKLLLGCLRILQFLAWDLLFSHVGWTIGWCFLRVPSFGAYPKEKLTELDQCSWRKALFVEMLGLAILCLLVVALKTRL